MWMSGGLYHSVWVDECLVSLEAWMAVCLSISLMLKLLSWYDGHSTNPSFPSRALRSEKHTGVPQRRSRGEILYLSWTERQTGELMPHKWDQEWLWEIWWCICLTLGLDSVTDSSSISCSLPREIHGWDSGVFGMIISSSSSSSCFICSSSSACTEGYKHNWTLVNIYLSISIYPSVCLSRLGYISKIWIWWKTDSLHVKKNTSKVFFVLILMLRAYSQWKSKISISKY